MSTVPDAFRMRAHRSMIAPSRDRRDRPGHRRAAQEHRIWATDTTELN